MENIVVIIVKNFNFILPIWIVSTLIATHVGFQRGFAFLGFLNGLVLGPLGLLFVLVQHDSRRYDCPHCSEKILKTASVCPKCRRDLGE